MVKAYFIMNSIVTILGIIVIMITDVETTKIISAIIIIITYVKDTIPFILEDYENN